jgi:broad specificity phosphatase PhoE
MSEEYPATTLLLIRHAQARASDSSHLGPDTPIGQLGRLQVAALVSRLVAAAPPTVVYTSPLPRAVQTASLVCERLGLEAVLDPRLTEFEMGTKEIEVILERPDLLIWHPEHRAADGETLREFSARVASFCDEVVERHPDERVVAVSHAGTIDAALRWALGITPDTPWQHEFELANASITELEFWPRGRIRGGASRYAVLRRVGDATHLGDLISEI